MKLWRREHYHFAFLDWFYRGLLVAVLCVIVAMIFALFPSPARAGNVEIINAKLARWVHPTHRCGMAKELLATQYGREGGPRTASGIPFNPDSMIAAHRTMPFGTRLIVTNPRNGKSVSVVIQDRGPYTHAQLDLSTGAARAIGMGGSAYLCVQ